MSNVGSNIFNLVYSRKYFRIRPTFSKKIWKHIVPVLVIFSTTLSTMIYVNSDTTMLGWMRGTEQVGYYAVAGKMYNIIKSTLNTEARSHTIAQWGQVLESWNKKEEKRSENFVKDL